MFRFLIALYVLTVWPHITLSHVLWAAFVALATFPLKKLWDWWSERFWESFKATFLASFKKTPGGAEFMRAFYESRAKKDAEVAREHPELEKLLHCKECGGKGCEECGGTGWA